ncbi:hypothetical protein NS234_16905 [Microbacterium oxydans]|nr:hypothetical protein NS234_16905 [Microbacterium oxydans]
MAAGVALVIVGALGSWWYASSARVTTTVFVTSGGITRGETIESQDLTTLELDGRQNTDAYTVEQSTDVIGKIATVDLPAGSLITPRVLGSTLAIEDGQSLVGFTLTGAQMPSYPLAAGDQVRIVDTPVAQGDPPADTPQTFPATVFSVVRDADNQQWVVNVIVPRAQAADLAARAATGRVALVLDGGQ